MFFGIKSTLSRFSKRPEITAKLNEQRMKKEWQEIVRTVHAQAVGKSEVVGVRNNTLIVRAANNLWLQEMFFYREVMKKNLSKDNGDIQEIKFVL